MSDRTKIVTCPRQEYADKAIRIFRDAGAASDDDEMRSVAFTLVSVCVHALANRVGVKDARRFMTHFVEASFAAQEILKARGHVNE